MCILFMCRWKLTAWGDMWAAKHTHAAHVVGSCCGAFISKCWAPGSMAWVRCIMLTQACNLPPGGNWSGSAEIRQRHMVRSVHVACTSQHTPFAAHP